MARKTKKGKDVSKFGGVEELGTVKMERIGSLESKQDAYDASSIEVQSSTKLEDDHGEGGAVVIRRFVFGINPEVFKERKPTKQDLFNHHLRGIEMAVFRDGMVIFDQVPPRLTFDSEKMQYSIFVAARPRKGYSLEQRPQTLSEIVHG